MSKPTDIQDLVRILGAAGLAARSVAGSDGCTVLEVPALGDLLFAPDGALVFAGPAGCWAQVGPGTTRAAYLVDFLDRTADKAGLPAWKIRYLPAVGEPFAYRLLAANLQPCDPPQVIGATVEQALATIGLTAALARQGRR